MLSFMTNKLKSRVERQEKHEEDFSSDSFVLVSLTIIFSHICNIFNVLSSLRFYSYSKYGTGTTEPELSYFRAFRYSMKL
jgi:hypothetical protein